MSRFLIATLLVAAFASPGAAQSLPLRTGDDVRVKSPSATGRFTVERVSEEALLLRDSAGVDVSVPVSSLSSLSVVRGYRTVGGNVVSGAATGLLIGAGIGVFIGLVSADDGSDAFISRGELVVLSAAVFGGVGTVVGAVVGAASPRERWARVPLAHGVRAGVSRDGGLVLGYRIGG